MAEKVNENVKCEAISGRLSDYFGFKLSECPVKPFAVWFAISCSRIMVRTRYYITYNMRIKLTKINY